MLAYQKLLRLQQVAGQGIDIELFFDFNRNFVAFLQTRFLELVNKARYFHMLACFRNPYGEFSKLVGFIRGSIDLGDFSV